MERMLSVYITCENWRQAKRLGERMLNKHLCVSVYVYPAMEPLYQFSPLEADYGFDQEVTLKVFCTRDQFEEIESLARGVTPFGVPSVYSVEESQHDQKHFEWLSRRVKAD